MGVGGNHKARPSFTLIELMAVVIILAILAGIALPKFFNYAAESKKAACHSALGGVRQAMVNYVLDKALVGSAAYPTAAQLATPGTVMEDALPPNPYNDMNTVLALSVGDANARWTNGTTGWCYYVDNFPPPVTAPEAVFWPNSNEDGENTF